MLVLSACGDKKQEQKEAAAPEKKEAKKEPVIKKPEKVFPGLPSYHSKKRNVYAQYPKGWSKKTETYEAVFLFLSPREKTGDIFQENVNLVIRDVEETVPVEEYDEVVLKELEKSIHNFKILSKRTVQIDEKKARELIYTGSFGKYRLKWHQLYLIHDKKVYVLTYTAEQNAYDKFLKEAKRVFDSFQILK
jgi:serine/threonine-protein kinase